MTIGKVKFCEFYYTIAVIRQVKSFHDSIFKKLKKPLNNRELDLYKIDNQHYPKGLIKC